MNRSFLKVVAFFCSLFVVVSLPYLGFAEDYGDKCVCPKGYAMYAYQTMILGVYVRPNIMMSCVAQGEPAQLCPKGSVYDESIELCTSPTLEDGGCPDGTWKAFYRDRCLAERAEMTNCPPGGQFDGLFGMCIAPCGEGKDSKGDKDSASEVFEEDVE